MVNPIFYFFYVVFKCLGNPLKRESNDVIASYGLVFVSFIIHLLILSIVLKHEYDIDLLRKMNRIVFGLLVMVLFYVSNYFALERNHRYIKILKQIKETPNYKKQTTALFLLVYGILPLLLKFI